jgi:hypothetical protein
MGDPKVPGQKTRLPYDVDEALKDAGYQVETTINPSAVQVVFDEQANLLTGSGPQAIDAQAARLPCARRAGSALRPRSRWSGATSPPAGGGRRSGRCARAWR